jgi:asparagine synthase (glutamine-hydrolysing)
MRFSGGINFSGEKYFFTDPDHASVYRGFNWFVHLHYCSSYATRRPNCLREDSFLVVGDIRLYEARDLSRALSIEAGHSLETDPALVLAAYRKWGKACLSYLTGEFAFAILDNSRNEVFLAVDHLATVPMCYWHEGSKFVFASDPGLLLAVPGIPRRLNRKKLAAYVLRDSTTGNNNETMHEGLFSLAPGTSLTVGSRGRELHTYWAPEIVADLIPKREEEVFEAVRELLFASVRNRLQGRRTIAGMLSGGLDSSSIVAIAARCLEKENREILALSSVSAPACGPRQPDEREFIEEFRAWPNVRIQFIDAPGRGPFDRLEELAGYATCLNQSSRQFVYQEIDRAALAGGSDIMLDGSFGELSATNWGRGYYVELAARSQWRTLIAEINRTKTVGAPRTSRKRALRSFASECANVFSPSRLRQPVTMLLADGFRCEHSSPARLHGILRQQELQREMVRSFMRGHFSRVGVPSLTSVRRTFPMLDKRLLEFCISVPGTMKVRGGYPRYLIRRALDGILPPKLQWRTSKMPFSPDYFVRYNAQLGMARKFVSAIGPKDPVRSIVNVSRLSMLLEPVHPVQGSFDALVTVPATIRLICFLRQFAEFRP